MLDAAHLAGRQATELSGGEQRRVHLARALATEANVLLLDEPFAGLDGEARTALLADAQSALQAPQRATLVVVHDRTEAWALADRLLVLLGGEIVAAGPPATVLAAPPSAAVARFLGYDGELRDGDELLLTRPAHVTVAPRRPAAGDRDPHDPHRGRGAAGARAARRPPRRAPLRGGRTAAPGGRDGRGPARRRGPLPGLTAP